MTATVATQFSWIRQLPDGRLQLVDDKNWAIQIVHDIRKVVATCRSHRGQEIAILDLERFGLTLVIDGWIQFAMLDEHRYHQLLVLPALLRHPNPRHVLILGGGDYLAAWRVLMRKGIECVKITDWDKTVPELVLAHIPKIRQLGVHEDPRVGFSAETDVAQYLPKTNERFDVIIEDLAELATLERVVPDALRHVRRMLKPGGAFVAQAGELSLAREPLKQLAATVRRVRELFRTVWVFGCPIESFSSTQAFIAGWLDPGREPTLGSWELPEKFSQALWTVDRPFYDPAIHAAAFTLEPAIRQAIGLSLYTIRDPVRNEIANGVYRREDSAAFSRGESYYGRNNA